MTMYKTLLKIALGFAAAAMLSATALAQSTILVVDTGRVLRDSDVAKASPLESKGKSLEAQLKGQTAQTLQTNTALQQQIKTFREDQQKVAIDLQYKQQEMKITEAKAVQKVQERLRTILKTIVAERNADVVLERSLVIYGDPVDVTDTVISRLNGQMKTVPVTRERLPRKS